MNTDPEIAAQYERDIERYYKEWNGEGTSARNYAVSMANCAAIEANGRKILADPEATRAFLRRLEEMMES